MAATPLQRDLKRSSSTRVRPSAKPRVGSAMRKFPHVLEAMIQPFGLATHSCLAIFFNVAAPVSAPKAVGQLSRLSGCVLTACACRGQGDGIECRILAPDRY